MTFGAGMRAPDQYAMPSCSDMDQIFFYAPDDTVWGHSGSRFEKRTSWSANKAGNHQVTQDFG